VRQVTALLIALALLTASSVMVANAVSDSERSRWNTWGFKAAMPTSRVDLGVAVVKGKIYAIGGESAANEMYDPATDTWNASKASMPTPRKGFGIAAYQDKIYAIGGLTDSDDDYYEELTGVNEVYNPATDTWENMTPMPTKRYGMDANVVEGKIYLIGGKNASGWIDRVNEVYDPATDSWTTKAPIPTRVSYYASAVVDNKIYVIGGYQGFEYTNLTQIYDPKTDTWSSGTPIPSSFSPLITPQAVATTGVWAPKRIYVIGASPPYGITSLTGYVFVVNNVPTQIYDPEKDAWSTCAAMLNPRIRFGITVVDDIVYAIGGTGSMVLSFQSCNDNQQYTPYEYGTVPPVVSVVSPENENYTSSNVSLAFTVNKPAVRLGYSLDGQEAVTVTGNTTLSGLRSGLHNVTVYAKDAFGNEGVSDTIIFTIVEPFPTALVIVIVAIVFTVIVGVSVYFKKRKS
jgi:hypothetical protein